MTAFIEKGRKTGWSVSPPADPPLNVLADLRARSDDCLIDCAIGVFGKAVQCLVESRNTAGLALLCGGMREEMVKGVARMKAALRGGEGEQDA